MILSLSNGRLSHATNLAILNTVCKTFYLGTILRLRSVKAVHTIARIIVSQMGLTTRILELTNGLAIWMRNKKALTEHVASVTLDQENFISVQGGFTFDTVTVENDLDTGDNTGDNLLSMTLRLRNQMDVETWLIYNGIDAYDEGFVQIRQQSNGQVLLEEEFYSIQTVFLGRCLKEQDLRTLFPLARDLAERCCTAGSEDVVEVSDDEIIPVVTISDDDSLFPRLSQSRKGKKRAPISRPAASQ
jgi:hypothetical protein